MVMSKKWIGAVSIICFALIILAACSKNNEETPDATASPAATAAPTQAPDGEEPAALLPFAETKTFTVFGRGFWNPIDSPIGYMDVKEKLNVNFEWDVYPDGYDEKKDITLATKNIKDLNQVYIRDGFNYGPKGAFLELSQYLDRMPNLAKKIEENAADKFAFQAEDGTFYVAPQFVRNLIDTDLGLAVNKDKFDEWGIPIPTTLDQFYEAAKTIKAKDSKYYPIMGFTAANQLFSVLRSLMNTAGIGDEPDVRYFEEEKLYKYSLLQPQFKESVAWLAKLYSEDLIFPEYPTTSDGGTRPFWNEWEVEGDDMYDHFISFMGSFTPRNSDQWQRFFERNARKVPPKYFNPQMEHLWISDKMSFNIKKVEPMGGLAINAEVAKDEAKLKDILTLVDWLYSEEAYLLFNYGREGWHYDLADGKPVMKDMFVSTKDLYHETASGPIFKKYTDVGYDVSKISLEDQIYSWGFYEVYPSLPLRMINDTNSFHQQFPSTRSHESLYKTLNEKIANATSIGKKPLPFNTEERNQITTVSQKARDFALTEVDKFILGKRPMEEFDTFIADLKKNGALELENIYNSKQAYLK